MSGDGAALVPARPRGAVWALALSVLLTGAGLGGLVLWVRAFSVAGWAATAAALALAGSVLYWRGHLSFLRRPAPRRRLWAAATALGLCLCSLGFIANIGLFGADAVGNAFSLALFYAAAGLPVVFYLKAMDGRRLSALMGGGGWAKLWRWFLAAGGVIALLFVVLCALEPTLMSAAAQPRMILILAGLLPFILVQAAAEELVFRGWLLPSIAARHGAVVGLAVSSLAFGASHVDFSAAPLIMALEWGLHTLSGVAFGLLALRQGGLLGVIGFHAGWNVGVTALAGPADFDWTASAPPLTALDLANPVALITVGVLILSRLALIWFALRPPGPALEARPAAD